ncbi:Protein of unknown function [Bacillus cytotoxicus]|nr:Protein of unknown function [Bacillus cytotoxicus]
MILLEHIVVLI